MILVCIHVFVFGYEVKILCLNQVAISGLKTFFDSHADVTFLDAPHPASGQAYPDVVQYFEPPFFEWWNAMQVVRM